MIKNKIHIIGPAGCGKSYLANALSNKCKIKSFDLDNIFWDNNSDKYNKIRPPQERDNLLNELLKNKDWIIEGVYYKWLNNSFKKSNLIIYLNISYILRASRIILRFIKRKLKIDYSKKKETLKSLILLLKWNHNYNNELKDFISTLKNRKDLIILNNVKEINNFIKMWPNYI